MDNCVSISADLHLAKTLDALKLKEEGEQRLIAENQDLKAELRQEKNTSQLLLDENKQLKSAQQELCGQMEELKQTNEGLRKELRERKESGGGGGGAAMGSSGKHCQQCDNIDRELAKLKSANDEVCGYYYIREGYLVLLVIIMKCPPFPRIPEKGGPPSLGGV